MRRVDPRSIGRVIATILLIGLAPSSGRAGFLVSDLGVLRGGHSSMGVAINASGQVAGSAALDSFHEVAIQGGGSSISSIGTLPGGSTSQGNAINNNGLIAGASEVRVAGANGTSSIQTHAFRTKDDGTLEDLGTMPGDSDSVAYGINAGGHIAGASLQGGGVSHAVIGIAPNTFRVIGDLGGGSGAALALNGSDQATGWSLTATQAQHAFRSTTSGMQDLGTLPGFDASQGTSINLFGDVVGFAGPAGSAHAFLSRVGSSLVDLGVLPFGSSCEAYGINDGRVVVGQTDYASGPSHAFVWDPATGVMHDLNDLIAMSSNILVVSANGINNTMQIAGTGLVNGELHAILLTPDRNPFIPIGQPVPEPSALILTTIGGLGLLARRWLRSSRIAVLVAVGSAVASPGR